MSEPIRYDDYPLTEIADAFVRVIAAGGTCFQKWTCDHCGSRQAMDTPNRIFTSGRCEECGGVTDIAAKGCNYLIITRASLPDIIESQP